MQVDLGKVSNISSVVTAGYQGYYQVPSGDKRQGAVNPGNYFNCQTTLFTVKVSKDAKSWQDVDCGRLYQTPWRNTPNAPVTTLFDTPVSARFLRFYPLEWNNGICLRMQVRTPPLLFLPPLSL